MIVRIGSRALQAAGIHCDTPYREHLTDATDHDLIATRNIALRWISTLPQDTEFATTVCSPEGDLDAVEKDIKQWKHLDSTLGLHYLARYQRQQQGKSIDGERVRAHTVRIRGSSAEAKMKFEIEIAEPGSSADTILQMAHSHAEKWGYEENKHKHGPDGDDVDNDLTGNCPDRLIVVDAPADVLEAIKSAHVIFPHNFLKHITDVSRLRCALQPPGASATTTTSASPLYWSEVRGNECQKLLVQRRVETLVREKQVPGEHLNLNQSSQMFLEGNEALRITRVVEHDVLHEIIVQVLNRSVQEKEEKGDDGDDKWEEHRPGCSQPRPAYEALRPHPSKAMMSKIKFDAATRRTQLDCVFEEVCSIALERYLLPGHEKDPESAYLRALTRVATTLTKGWFREFVIDHWLEVQYGELCARSACGSRFFAVAMERVRQVAAQFAAEERQKRLEAQREAEAKATAEEKRRHDQAIAERKRKFAKYNVSPNGSSLLYKTFRNEPKYLAFAMRFDVGGLHSPIRFPAGSGTESESDSDDAQETSPSRRVDTGSDLIRTAVHAAEAAVMIPAADWKKPQPGWWFRARDRKTGLDLIFTAQTACMVENGGWCSKYQYWGAFVALFRADDSSVTKRWLQDWPVDGDFAHEFYKQQEFLEEKWLRLTFSDRHLLDDSYSKGAPNLPETTDFGDLAALGMPDDFWIRFILAFADPPPLRELEAWLPSSDDADEDEDGDDGMDATGYQHWMAKWYSSHRAYPSDLKEFKTDYVAEVESDTASEEEEDGNNDRAEDKKMEDTTERDSSQH